jgi:hypothetical protein
VFPCIFSNVSRESAALFFRVENLNLEEAVLPTIVVNFNLNTRRHIPEYLTVLTALYLTRRHFPKYLTALTALYLTLRHIPKYLTALTALYLTRRHIPEYLTALTALYLTRCPFCCSCGPAPQSEMVSRRRILSRSRDDLNLDSTYVMQEEEEDVWYQRDKLYKVRAADRICLSSADRRNRSVEFHIRIPLRASEVNNQFHSVAAFFCVLLLLFCFSHVFISIFISIYMYTPLLICFSFLCLMISSFCYSFIAFIYLFI